MDRFVGFFRYYTSNALDRTPLYATEAEALAAVEARMNSDPSIREGYVCKIMSKSVRNFTIETTSYETV
jgi:hypothetical protein